MVFSRTEEGGYHGGARTMHNVHLGSGEGSNPRRKYVMVIEPNAQAYAA